MAVMSRKGKLDRNSHTAVKEVSATGADMEENATARNEKGAEMYDKDDSEVGPLCAVHRHLEDADKLECEIGNDCVACSLNERRELLELIAPFANNGEDSITVLRRVVEFYQTHPALVAASTAPPSAAATVDLPHKLINFLTALEHQARRNHEYHPALCGECLLTETIANRIHEQLGLPQVSATASPVALRDEANFISPIGYERAITLDWPKHNARHHELIKIKRSRSLSGDETAELAELQWLAGIKRELQTGPPPVPLQDEAANDDGWVTFGRVKVDIENETETFERIDPATAAPSLPPRELARAAAEECEALITCLLSGDEKENTRRHFAAIVLRTCFSERNS